MKQLKKINLVMMLIFGQQLNCMEMQVEANVQEFLPIEASNSLLNANFLAENIEDVWRGSPNEFMQMNENVFEQYDTPTLDMIHLDKIDQDDQSKSKEVEHLLNILNLMMKKDQSLKYLPYIEQSLKVAFLANEVRNCYLCNDIVCKDLMTCVMAIMFVYGFSSKTVEIGLPIYFKRGMRLEKKASMAIFLTSILVRLYKNALIAKANSLDCA